MSKLLYPSCPVLLVDDEPVWLRSLSLLLERKGGINHTVTCSDGRQVLEVLGERDYALVVLDYTMPHLAGSELLQRIVGQYPDLPVVMLTGRNQVDVAVECMKAGAFDFFTKTMEEERLVAGVQRAIRMQELELENRKLRDGYFAPELEAPAAFAELRTQSPQLLKLFRYAEAIAQSSQPVLITGESGVGKELLGQAFHRLSRPDAPWVPVNVAGLDESIFADTLFGHAKGAFTDADQARLGMIDKAAGGTLFLDEIGSLNLASQAKLLRVLQDGEYFPLGSDRPKKMTARVIVATNQDLPALIERDEFRRDLYFRLRTHHLHIPPLRERNGDLGPLLEHFLAEAAAELGKPVPTPPRELLPLLATYDFPGNVRELRAMVYDAVAMHRSHKLSMEAFKRAMGRSEELPVPVLGDTAAAAPVTELVFPGRLPTIRDTMRSLVEEAMRRASGNQGVAAEMLGISRPALNKRLKKLAEGDDED